jgi:AcrR family transcriptional regulator
LSATRAKRSTSEDFAPLPAGRHRLGPTYVEAYQRRRLLVAVAELAHEQGLAGVTVSGLAERARISRKTFYDYFANRDEFVDYATTQAASQLCDPIAEIVAKRGGEEEAVAAGVHALLDAIRSEPKLAELALIHAPALGGERGRSCQETVIEALSALPALAAGAEGRAPGAETIAAAMIGVIACRLRGGDVALGGEVGDDLIRLARLPALAAEPESGAAESGGKQDRDPAPA